MNEGTTTDIAAAESSSLLGGFFFVALIVATLFLPHLLSFWQGYSKRDDIKDDNNKSQDNVEIKAASSEMPVVDSTDENVAPSPEPTLRNRHRGQPTNDFKGNNQDQPDLSNDNNWRCACEGGFLPPGLLQTFGGAEAVMRMSTGQCYHKQT